MLVVRSDLRVAVSTDNPWIHFECGNLGVSESLAGHLELLELFHAQPTLEARLSLRRRPSPGTAALWWPGSP